MLLIGVRGISDIWGSVRISLDISSCVDSEWGAMSSVDIVGSSVGGSLILNSEDSTNDDSGNILIRTYVSSYGAERSIMVALDSWDSP